MLQRDQKNNELAVGGVIPEGGLLQSEYWANVMKAEDKDVWHCDGFNKRIYCVNYKLPLVGRYTYCPRVYNLNDKEIEKLIQEALGKKLGWLRLDVLDKKMLKRLKIKHTVIKAPHNMQPKRNFIIDINLPEEYLLIRMKSKTRYNIRLAKRKEVEILVTREQEYIDKFIDLVEQTAKRKKVTFHERGHYLQMFQNIPEDILQLYVAKYKSEVIAANIVSFYGGVATYLHGATSDRHRNVMAPFLLQWQAILDAKKRGLKYYDFGGVFPENGDKGQRGITRFKFGFSSQAKPFQTIGSYDIILNKPKYWLYRVLQKIKF